MARPDHRPFASRVSPRGTGLAMAAKAPKLQLI